MAEEKSCLICETPAAGNVLVGVVHDGAPASLCFRCFHGLLHGLSLEEMRQRWAEYQGKCGHHG